jgi:hypothetical protein
LNFRQAKKENRKKSIKEKTTFSTVPIEQTDHHAKKLQPSERDVFKQYFLHKKYKIENSI